MKQKMILMLCLLLFGASISAYGQNFRMRFCRDAQAYGVQHRRSGAWAIEPKYDRQRHPAENSRNFRFVRCDDKWGVVNLRTGKEVIPCQFDEIVSSVASNNVVPARLNDKWGYIHIPSGITIVPFIYPTRREARNSDSFTINGRVIAERIRIRERGGREYIANSFNLFANQYVEAGISQWQSRSGFESLEDWQLRVNENSRQAKALELFREAELAFIEERSHNFLTGASLGFYNTNNESFLLQTSLHGTLLVPVSINEEQNFRSNWNSHLRMPHFMIHNDRLAFSGITFIAADGTASRYNFSNPVEINISESNIAFLQNQRVSTADIAALPTQNDTREAAAERQNRTVQRPFQQGDFTIGGHLAILPESELPTFGIGTSLRYNVTNPVRLKVGFTYFLRTARVGDARLTESLWDLSMNMHYLFTVAENTALYPLLGFSVVGGAERVSYGGESSRRPFYTDFFFNLGGGKGVFGNTSSIID